MKKILLVLFVLILTGCFNDSGYITKSCVKQETANSLNSKTEYSFKFKNDTISEISVLYSYSDDNKITIDSIRSSIESQNKFLDLDYEVLVNTSDIYEIKYNIDLNSEQEILNKFMIKTSRTELVRNLKEQGFVCE